ncbi:YD repeat-containing protein [Mucilaginibacter sp. UYP25]|uniref:DUF5977 domain-containing protein n=1 Tax=unclassified Mucilaginibacter TaxID=2617802 RepID=UPI003394FAEB
MNLFLRFITSAIIGIIPCCGFAQYQPSHDINYLPANSANPVPPDASDNISLIDILPPSPNSVSLGKYGGVNVGLASGMIDVKIPLFILITPNLSVPIDLRYTSNGLKTDEIASHVGMSWALNAGGLITRTVMGQIDESSTRLIRPADFPTQNQNLLTFAENLTNTNYNDGEPDIFSFNFDGNTGQFILDNNKNPYLLTYSALKIEKDFSGGASWNFKVTTPAGVQYFFGGSTATETTNKYQSGCGKGYPNFTPTAWYLTKIVHPNHDEVNFLYAPVGFHYQTGVNQTMNSRYVAYANLPTGSGIPPPTLIDQTCVSWYQTRTVYLTEINAIGSGKIAFSYIDRTDVTDKLLSRIEIFGTTNPGSAMRTINFAYQNVTSTLFVNSFSNSDASLKNRPYLTEVSEVNSVTVKIKTHKFEYNNLDELPPRLTFAQDSYGYFNGKTNNTLIPTPSIAEWQSYLPNATANRNPDPAYAMKGILKKITYPTGGTETLSYEGNVSYVTTTIPGGQKIISISGSGLARQSVQRTNSNTFTVSTSGITADLKGHCDYYTAAQYPYDPIHHVASIALVDLTNGGEVVVSSTSMHDGDSFLQKFIPLIAGHIYQLRITASGEQVTGSGSITYVGNNPITLSGDKPASAVRVAKIVTNDGFSSPAIKRFFYYDPSTPNQSSAQLVYTPIYEKYLRTYTIIPPGTGGFGGGSGLYCDPVEYDFYRMTSYSQTNIYAYSSPVSYSFVTESSGENFEDGGADHKFLVSPDQLGTTVLGEYIQSQPLSGYNWRNGRELYNCDFKMYGSTKIPVKKVFTHYIEDPRVENEIKSYVVNKKYSPNCVVDPPSTIQLNAYDLTTYSHFREWSYIDTVKTWIYDNSGTNWAEKIVSYEYANTNHTMLTKSTESSSTGEALTTTYAYPQDLALTGIEETARQVLVDKNIISPILYSKTMKGNKTQFSTQTDYMIYPNTLVLPHILKFAAGASQPEPRVTIDSYNDFGKILSQSKVSGPSISYIWGYGSRNVIAEVKNAGYQALINVLGQGAVNALGSVNPGTDESVQTTLNPLRTQLSNSQVTTFTFDPLVGMTSITDSKGQTTYYEYDAFQRLLNIKDQNKNILKNYQYNYGQISPPVYWNEEQFGYFNKACTVGIGTLVKYTVPAHTYSAESLSAANALAQADVTANGQANANAAPGATCQVLPYAILEQTSVTTNGNAQGYANYSIKLYTDDTFTTAYVATSKMSINYRVQTSTSVNNGTPTVTSSDYTAFVSAGSSTSTLGQYENGCGAGGVSIVAQGSQEKGASKESTTTAKAGAETNLVPPGGGTTCVTKTITILNGTGYFDLVY